MRSRDHEGLDNLGILFLVLGVLASVIFGIIAITELVAALRAEANAGAHWIGFWTYLLIAIVAFLNGFIVKAVFAWMYDLIRIASSMNENLALLTQRSRPAPTPEGSGARTATRTSGGSRPSAQKPEAPRIETTPWGGQQCSECYRNLPAGDPPPERCPHCGARFATATA